MCNVALHVLDDHDGVVDHQAGGQRDAEEGERVDGEAEELDEGEGADERDRNGDGGNDGGAPVEQEEEDDGDDDDDGLAEGDQHFADRVADDGGGVEGDGVFQARRKALGELGERGLGSAIHVERVGVGELLDADAHRLRWPAILERGAVVFSADSRSGRHP